MLCIADFRTGRTISPCFSTPLTIYTNWEEKRKGETEIGGKRKENRKEGKERRAEEK
jgi:hypothetical protein